MATLNGIGGRVRWENFYTEHVHAWSMDVIAEALEDTAWEYSTSAGVAVPTPGSGADGWRTYQAGLRGFAGSFECYQDDVDVAFIEGEACEIYLHQDADTYWHGMAFCTGVHASAPIEGKQTVTIDFQGTLYLTGPWTTTTS